MAAHGYFDRGTFGSRTLVSFFPFQTTNVFFPFEQADETVHVSVPLLLTAAKTVQCTAAVDYRAPPNSSTSVLGDHHKVSC